MAAYPLLPPPLHFGCPVKTATPLADCTSAATGKATTSASQAPTAEAVMPVLRAKGIYGPGARERKLVRSA